MATPLTASALLAALKAEGCKVREYKSWRTHNRNSKGAWGPVNGVLLHHTASSSKQGSIDLCYDGRSDLPGPLCHAVISKDGEVILVGNGRANHAGGGDPRVLAQVIDESYSDKPTATAKHDGSSGAVDGNARFYGFECINLGTGKDPWPEAQLDAIERASAAICRAYGWSSKSVIGHLEWSDWKVDPKGFTMPSMRGRIADRLKHSAGWDRVPATPTPPAIVPKSRESAATVKAQQAKALKAWPFILDVEKTYSLPAGLLLAVGSRETNLTNKVGDGGHGHGVWQRDDRWHTMPAGYDADVRAQAIDAAGLLSANIKAVGLAAGVAAYNAGLTGVRNALAAGKSADSATTGGDYAADVLGRLALITPIDTKESTMPTGGPFLLALGHTGPDVLTDTNWHDVGWETEYNDEGTVHAAGSSTFGYTGYYEGAVYVRLSNLTKGEETQLRIVEVNSTTGAELAYHPIVEGVGTDGSTFFAVPVLGKLPAGRKLKVQIAVFDEDASVTIDRLDLKLLWTLLP